MNASQIAQSCLPELRTYLNLSDAGLPGDEGQDVPAVHSDSDVGIHRHSFCALCEAGFIRRRLAADRFLEAVGMTKWKI